MQILPQHDPWGEIAQNIGAGAAEGYVKSHDDRAIQNAIQKLGPNPQARDLLQAVLGAKTYSNESKKQALEQYADVEKVQSAIQKGEENKQKAIQERQQVKNIVKNLKIPEDQKESLGESLSLKAAEKLYTDQLKPKKEELSIFEKTIQQKEAEKYVNLLDDIPKLQTSIENLDYAQELSDQIGLGGQAASAFGWSEVGAELEGVTFPLIEPIVKIFNPSGPIAERKLKRIQDQYQIKGSDFYWQRNAKIKALKRFAQQGLKRAQEKKVLIEKYNGKPPKGIIDSFDKETNDELDSMVDRDENTLNLKLPKDFPEPNEVADTTITLDDGTKVYSDGTTWKKI